MPITSKQSTSAHFNPSYVGNKSNSQVIENIPLGSIKLPDKPIKPPSPQAIALCRGNLERYGQLWPVPVFDDNTPAHCLEIVLAAQELGSTHINIVRLSAFSEIDQKIITLSAAKIPFLSDWNPDSVRSELQEILSFDPELIDLTGFSMGEIDVILDPETANENANPLDVMPETPSADEVVSRPGDMFLLADHKILCGDSQKPENFDQLIGKEKARAAITDPPWNIPIKNNVSGLGKIKHGDFAMGVGEMSPEKFTEFLVTRSGTT